MTVADSGRLWKPRAYVIKKKKSNKILEKRSIGFLEKYKVLMIIIIIHILVIFYRYLKFLFHSQDENNYIHFWLKASADYTCSF